MNVLVLGVGGNVSQGILKALACSKLQLRVLTACVNPRAFGLYTGDKSFVSPLANSPQFIPWLIDLCKNEKISGVLSGSEPVLEILAKYRDLIFKESQAKSVVNRLGAIAIGGDKLKTCRWLKKMGLPHPAFAPFEDEREVDRLVRSVGFPLIAKPRRGKGASGIFHIECQRDLERARVLRDYVVQECIGTADEEYTAACFADRNDAIRGSIVFHRYLQSGTTIAAMAGLFPAIRTHAIQITEKLRPRGSCNIQFRLKRGKPVCFEINVRFSGTTPVRARLGFNDVEAAIRHYVLDEPSIDLPLIVEGQALRYWNEFYVSSSAFHELTESSQLSAPRQFPSLMEDYGSKP